MRKFVYECPYIFKTGKHQGQPLEDSFFKDFSLVYWLIKKRETLLPPLGQHLDFLLEISKKFETKIICPVCKTNKIKYFYLLPGNIISEKLTSCDNPDCQQSMKNRYDVIRTIPIKFEALGQLPKKNLIIRSGKLFKKFYGLPRVLKKETIFNLFKSKYLPEPEEIEPVKKSRRFVDGFQISLF